MNIFQSNPHRIAVRNLLSYRLNTIGITLTVSVICASYITFEGTKFGTYQGLRALNTVLNHAGDLAIFAKENDEFDLLNKPSIPEADVTKIEQTLGDMPLVERTEKVIVGAGLLSDGCFSYPVIVKGVENSTHAEHQIMTDIGAALKNINARSKVLKSDSTDDLPSVSLTTRLMQRIGKKYDDKKFGKQTEIFPACDDLAKKVLAYDAFVQLSVTAKSGYANSLDFTIASTHNTSVEEFEDVSVEIPLSDAQNLFEMQGVSYVAVYLKPSVVTSDVIEQFESKFSADNNFDVYAGDSIEMNSSLFGLIPYNDMILTFFQVLLVFFMLAAIFNFLVLGIEKRSKDFGIYLMLGYRAKDLRLITLLEYCYGVSLGVGLGIVWAELFRVGFNAKEIPWDFKGVVDQYIATMVYNTRSYLVPSVILIGVSSATISAYCKFLITDLSPVRLVRKN